ncbi:Retrovirus-related Pol polyprotein LINE-1 [Zea mays]|uniref:Retrovirus-related Pol polyprotein LINE-1 n=1 Tax=Zea mays TaxID=4577 RepID=A0A1D6LVG4_MAIZE|nr:Retrovirus-related Pol polyprotein LINE-1 [Zea mays]
MYSTIYIDYYRLGEASPYIYILYSSPRVMDPMVHHLDHPGAPAPIVPAPIVRATRALRGSCPLDRARLHRRALSHFPSVSDIPTYISYSVIF